MFLLGAVLVGLFGVLVGGCSSDESSPGGDTDGFISDNPDLNRPSNPNGGSGTGGTSSGGAGGGGGSGGGGGGDAERAIEEADIIQLQDDRLYALSRYGGLSVIDVAQRDRLDLLGRFKTDAQPFEMYLRGSVVFGLFNEYTSYVETADSWQWVSTSRLLTLDVSNPADIRVLSDQTLPGNISDSRVVGDVLYVVTHENGYCYGCDSHMRTAAVSYDISQPSNLRQAAQLFFDETQDEWGWATRSISVTDQRMYIGGRDYNDGAWGSKIEVVDISDPGGTMQRGVTLRAEGEIESRWQLDEHDGVLRVLSQPGVWSTSQPPVLQTFRVTSAQDIAPLARLPLVLPRPERLRSVRFDGDRGYAITFERTDPLFTFDLSDAAAPLQMGELEIPGWVYHMEPRGDRVLALGFEPNNPEGALHVSIFDVSDLSQPKQLSRVNFGGSWANLAEDQDRIHKAFNLLEPQGLILVPYSGYTFDDSSRCGGYQSGVQLIDWSRDALVKRGVAPSVGQSRRAFVHQDRLFTVSDDRVQTFDLSDRDQPAQTAKLALARRVSKLTQVGANLLRVGADWWTSSTELDVVPLSDASAPDALGSVEIESLSQGSCGYGLQNAQLFSHGNIAYLVYDDYADYYSGESSMALAVVDAAAPESPKLLFHQKLDTLQAYGYGGYSQVVATGQRVVQIGSTLALLRFEGGGDDASAGAQAAHVLLVDLSEPAAPKTTRVELPSAQGLTGLVRLGRSVYTSHFEPLAGDPGRVRFYVDRVDITDVSAPRLSKVNVPGSLLSVDASGKLITLSYARHSERVGSYSECYERHNGVGQYLRDQGDSINPYDGPGSCSWYTHSMQLLSVNAGQASVDTTRALADGQRPERVAMGDGVLFAQLDSWWNSAGGSVTPKLQVLSGFAAGRLDLAQVAISAEPLSYSYIDHLVASGKRAAFVRNGQTLGVVDASDLAAPALTHEELLQSYPEDLLIDAGQIYLSLGYEGVETRPLQ